MRLLFWRRYEEEDPIEQDELFILEGPIALTFEAEMSNGTFVLSTEEGVTVLVPPEVAETMIPASTLERWLDEGDDGDALAPSG